MGIRIRFTQQFLLFAGVLSASVACVADGQQQTGLAPSADSTTVSCVDLPANRPRPPHGCFNLAHVSGLTFSAPAAVWFLYTFRSESAAEAARGPHDTVVAETGSFWLSQLASYGTKPARYNGGLLAAQVGPLVLPRAANYTAALAYAVMQPGQRSRTHTHAGPEAFYVVSGEQCVETPAGIKRARAGESFSEAAGVPMELEATGSAERRGFALVLHDATQAQAAPTTWRSSSLCGS